MLDTTNYTMKVYDGWLDLDLGNYEKFVKLKQQNGNLKTMIAIGGWTDSVNNAWAYKLLFADQSKIDKFARWVLNVKY